MVVTTRLMKRLILDPMEQLRAGAEQVGRGDLDYQIDFVRQDEIGQVAQAFNEMAGRLRDREALLTARTAALETEVLEHRQTEEKLRQAELKYRTLVEHLPAITFIVEFGKTNRTIYISPQIETILGFTVPEWLADPELWIKQLHPDDRDRVLAEIQHKDDTYQPVNLEYRVLTRDGRVVWLYNQTTWLQAEPGQPRYTHGIMFDITARKQLEEQYRQAQKMNAVGQLAAGIAHDFNNLLTVINGFAEFLRVQLPSDSPNLELVDKILHSGRRAAELVSQLLTFSRKQAISPRVVDLNSVIRNMDWMLRRMTNQQIELITVLAPDLWPVTLDPAQFEQAIINLAVNAQDAMPQGGLLRLETANVRLEGKQSCPRLDLPPGEYVRLAVSDTGAGMSAEIKAHIFEPFFTTKEVGKGTGLGLAVVFGMVKQSGGDIQVESEEGAGTTFEIYLPRAKSCPLSPARPPDLTAILA